MTYQVKIPSCSYGGEGSIEKIKEIIAKEKSQKVVVFSDEGIKATGLLDILTKQLDETGVQYHVFTDCKPEPSYLQVEAVVDMVQGQECDLIIGLGGGSVMDAAKLASVLKGAPYTIKDLLNDPTQAEKKVKTVMIPTTWWSCSRSFTGYGSWYLLSDTGKTWKPRRRKVFQECKRSDSCL